MKINIVKKNLFVEALIFCLSFAGFAEGFDEPFVKKIEVSGIEWEQTVSLISFTEYSKDGKSSVNEYNSGYKIFREYDKRGNLIHEKSGEDFEKWNEYNSKGKIRRTKTCDYIENFDYDSKGHLVKSEIIKNGQSIIKKYECDSEGRILHSVASDGEEVFCKYDEDGLIVSYSCSSGHHLIFEHNMTWERNKEDKITFIKDSNGMSTWAKYDDKDNVILTMDKDGGVLYTEYEYYPDGKLKLAKSYKLGNDVMAMIIFKHGMEKVKNTMLIKEQIFDENMCEIYCNDAMGEKWFEYDDDGLMISANYDNQFVEYYEYDYDTGKQLVKKEDGSQLWREIPEQEPDLHTIDEFAGKDYSNAKFSLQGSLLYNKDENDIEYFYEYQTDEDYNMTVKTYMYDPSGLSYGRQVKKRLPR